MIFYDRLGTMLVPYMNPSVFTVDFDYWIDKTPYATVNLVRISFRLCDMTDYNSMVLL